MLPVSTVGILATTGFLGLHATADLVREAQSSETPNVENAKRPKDQKTDIIYRLHSSVRCLRLKSGLRTDFAFVCM